MSDIIKDVSIKNGTYYFFNDIINTKNLDPNNIKIDEKSYKNIRIYYTGYETNKNDLKICRVDTLFSIK